MAQLNFPSGAIASTTTADISAIKIRKNLGRPGVIAATTVASVGALGKKRSVKPDPIAFTCGLSGTLKRKLKFPPGVITSTTNSQVKFFLNVSPAAPPKGSLYRADLSTLLQPGSSAPAFSGSRLVKGDLTPLSFKIQGQKLDGLNAEFTTKRKDDPLAAPIVKSGSAVHQSDPAVDGQTKIETVMGSFALDPGDTESFPDSEVELSYTLKFSDGLGRVYTVASGNFTVYSAG
ncbi:hypothetical protein [Nostoc sp. TCL240-02]|uniref:hypothetical protein n=1 Tax=Nostoc sp. TCL240-02 TaxID=2572090 RepID=UPI00157FA06C|nr:hypothetical protein [Nostoc sp. TCL240-02]QKQ75652.1 hypothetical protein FBB35_22255 [Nostoc sp. TCL240-02]